MSEEEIEPTEESPKEEQAAAARRRYFTRRNGLITAGVAGIGLVLLALFATVGYRYGVFDNYIKNQFIAKMDEIGVVFSADVFRVTVNPLELELRNATFNDKVSGEKLFFIRDARLGLTIQNLFAWDLSRDISVDSTEVSGAEVWVKFDENSRSNFANLFFEDMAAESRLNFKYSSVRFTLRDSIIHFNDASRRIGADANNVQATLEPENYDVPDDEKRYKIGLTASGSTFTYNESTLENISVSANGIANAAGAEITELRIDTPIGTSYLAGTISDWTNFTYNLAIESTVDLTQTSNTFPLGATLRGVGNFKGTVSGSGENYKIDGKVDSDAITAEGVYLKALNVNATVEGTNSNYEANGNAVAELLTFEDFRVDFPRMSGNVRGTGTDFRWVGELQAIAAKTKSLTLGGLFLSDAVAEFKDRQLTASAGNGRAQKFSIQDTEFAELAARNLRFSLRNGAVELTAPSARARTFKTKDYTLSGVDGRDIKVTDNGSRTQVTARNVTSERADVKGTQLKNVRADNFDLVDRPNSTELTAKNLRAETLNADGTRIDGLESPEITLRDAGGETVIYSDTLRVARIDTADAVLGSLNIAGVRLTIRQGTVRATSNDFDAGTVVIKNGGTLESVAVSKPIFTLEPSGRYRATADMSIGGGVLGSVPLGAATANVYVTNDRTNLNNIVAEVMNGRVEGDVSLPLFERLDFFGESRFKGKFTGLDLSKLIALQTGRVITLEGKATGDLDLTSRGNDIDGTINADITAGAGSDTESRIPVNGKIALVATDGIFDVRTGNLRTEKSTLDASGQFAIGSNNSNLNLALRSSDANEIDRLVRVLGVSPELEKQLDAYQVQVAGGLELNARITGNLEFLDRIGQDPNAPKVSGAASIASVTLRGREVGSLRSDIAIDELGYAFKNGILREPAGSGEISFNVQIPPGEANGTTVYAKLENVNAGNLIAAIPVELPSGLRDFNGLTSGTVDLRGLPDNASGSVDLKASNGTISGEAFDALTAKAVFAGTRIDIETAEIRVGEGFVNAKGFYDRRSTQFDLKIEGKALPLQLALAFLPDNTSVPAFSGLTDLSANAKGFTNDKPSFNVTFNGTARDVVINENSFGVVTFNGNTENQILTADLTANVGDKPQVIKARLEFADPDLPFRVETGFDQSPLAPFFALIPQLRGISIGGTGTGQLVFGGNLSRELPDGTREMSTAGLSGTANFSQLALLIQDTPLTATEPVSISFSPSAITFTSARFAGGGSNLTIAGTKALTDDGLNDLNVNGRLNLALLNVIPAIAATDTFFGGFANVAMQVSGVNRTAVLSGTAEMENASVAAFIGTDRLSFDRVKAKLLFTSNQAQIESAEGYLGGGRFVAEGGILFGNNLQIDSYRVGLTGTNVTVPLPNDFITTGDARLEISGFRRTRGLSSLIAGSIIARRSLYSKDIELANVVGGRREGSITGGGSGTVLPTRFDLTIEGQNALVVRNNIADLTASVSLRLTGTSTNPEISGRIVATQGTILFRKDRYEIQRGVLEFPPNTTVDPIINLQAETEINGYQIYVNLSGPLTDTELLNATVRSSPALPQPDVISLITTGSLSNTEAGIPTLASTGLNTAAEVLTDSIINNPARRATDKLFGLNVFEIDPIISGERINPTARLTVGRQINNNLRVTYSTNLSQDQNQVLALEYRVSNKLSFVAQYEQRSLSNVTSNRDNFSFEVRFRRRF
jgi:translocation and assembly module TamB